jgi:hypothetical protein
MNSALMESTMTMPAGRYFIGDLYRVMKNDWKLVYQTILDGDEPMDGEFELYDGRLFASYAVNSNATEFGEIKISRRGPGCIGCILVGDIRDPHTEKQLRKKGMVVEFTAPFKTSGCWDTNIIKFGDITIDTSE